MTDNRFDIQNVHNCSVAALKEPSDACMDNYLEAYKEIQDFPVDGHRLRVRRQQFEIED